MLLEAPLWGLFHFYDQSGGFGRDNGPCGAPNMSFRAFFVDFNGASCAAVVSGMPLTDLLSAELSGSIPLTKRGESDETCDGNY